MKRIFTNSRAIIEVQFNWIFVLIAGFAIFLFIISIIWSQKKVIDEQLNLELAKDLTAAIKSKQQLTNAYTEIFISSPLQMSFKCIDDSGYYRVDDAKADERLPTELVFAPAVLTSNTFKVWVRDFSTPFVAARFLYITSPKKMYIIYSKDEYGMVRQIYDDLPSNLSKVYADVSDPAGSQKYREAMNNFKGNYRIICIDPDCPDPDNQDYLKIIPDVSTNDIYSFGSVVYHKKGQADPEGVPYITSSSLFGAIFSDSPDYYRCEMSRALAQFQIKRMLYYKRLKLMEPNLMQTNLECASLIAQHENALISMKAASLTDVKKFYGWIKDLEQYNQDSGFKACPKVN